MEYNLLGLYLASTLYCLVGLGLLVLGSSMMSTGGGTTFKSTSEGVKFFLMALIPGINTLAIIVGPLVLLFGYLNASLLKLWVLVYLTFTFLIWSSLYIAATS